MNRVIFLDTGPLGVVANSKRPPATIEILQWAAGHLRAGNKLIVPAIADFEVRRELVRLNRPASVESLDLWNSLPDDRYLPLTDSALRRAARLWADARNQGSPTADARELDCDVLIAAQALDYQERHNPAEIIIATVNVGHLARFLPANIWQNIVAP